MPIKGKDLAAHWGVSGAYVSKVTKLKVNPCPLTSLADADKWRRLNSVRGAGTKSKVVNQPAPAKTPKAVKLPKNEPQAPKPPKPPPAEAPPVDPPAPPPEDLTPRGTREQIGRLTTLASALAASIDVQTQAYGLVQDSMHGGSGEEEWLGHRIVAYNKATEGRLKTEQAVQELEVAAERLLPYEKHAELLSRVLMPMFTRLWTLGKRIAFRVNPHDPVLAEREITIAIKAAVKEAKNDAFPVPADFGVGEPPEEWAPKVLLLTNGEGPDEDYSI